LSAAHLFRGGVSTVKFCDGRQCASAELLALEPTDDLALLETTLKDCGGVPIATTRPAIGDPVQVWGWGNSSEKLLSQTGRCVAYDSFCEHVEAGAIKASVPAREGDSGGPMIDANGHICGVVSCSDGRATNGSCCDRIRAFFRRVFGRRRPAMPLPGPAPIVKPPVTVDPRPMVPVVPEPSPVVVPEIPIPSNPPAPEPVETTPPIVPAQPPIEANPSVTATTPPDKHSGIPWAALLAYGATGVLGGGLPVWAVMAYRGAKLAKQLRDARTPNDPIETNPPARHTHTTTVVDAPPAVDRYRTESQFINVESDHYQRAHEEARRHIARRYPGSQEILAAELDLTHQFAAGIPKN
jgi:hypothetical protein